MNALLLAVAAIVDLGTLVDLVALVAQEVRSEPVEATDGPPGYLIAGLVVSGMAALAAGAFALVVHRRRKQPSR